VRNLKVNLTALDNNIQIEGITLALLLLATIHFRDEHAGEVNYHPMRSYEGEFEAMLRTSGMAFDPKEAFG
jgi:hypothetical protein